jgi:hypothetical protein
VPQNDVPLAEVSSVIDDIRKTWRRDAQALEMCNGPTSTAHEKASVLSPNLMSAPFLNTMCESILA